MTVRFRLDEVLAERQMSQTDLARLSGVSLVTVNAIKQNRTTRVDLSTLDAICTALEVPPGDLLAHQAKPKRRGKP